MKKTTSVSKYNIMKTLKTISLIGLFFCTVGLRGQTSEKNQIRETITAFSQAGDRHAVNELNELLDDNYRVVMNRLFGSETVAVVDKSVYLHKIGTKEWGGDERTITIENLTVNGTTAYAKVTLKGKKATFVSLMSLVKNQNGLWKLIGDLPMVQ